MTIAKCKTKFLVILLAFATVFASVSIPAVMATTNVVSAASTTKATTVKLAGQVVSQKAKSGDTKTKLKNLYAYVKGFRYQSTGSFSAVSGWDWKYAYAGLKTKKGTCYHYAAAFAYLAKKATGCTVKIATGKTNGFTGKLQNHAWVEIQIGGKWYVFDANLEQQTKKNGFYQKKDSVKKLYNNFKAVKYVTVSL